MQLVLITAMLKVLIFHQLLEIVQQSFTVFVMNTMKGQIARPKKIFAKMRHVPAMEIVLT
jgi:hypothetical protein